MVSLNGLMIVLILSINQQTHGYPTIDNSNSHKGRLILPDTNNNNCSIIYDKGRLVGDNRNKNISYIAPF